MDGNRIKTKSASRPKLIAILGPFQSGKTTLLEGLLARSGAIARQGSVRDKNSVGDTSAEARAHAMSVEPNLATIDYLGDRYTFIDCPGSIEFSHDFSWITPCCDAAVVVCENDPRKLPALQLILRSLEDANIPRLLFLNKIDTATARVRETLTVMQSASRTPLVLRQIPIWRDGIACGFIDLALERAFVYREHAPSQVIDLPNGELPREKEARFAMLEKLADYDDALMEELIGDIDPPRDQVFEDLRRELCEGLVVPLMIGSAERGNGLTRLLKALRHEAPDIAQTRARLGVDENGPVVVQALRAVHTAHGGKQTTARVIRGTISDGATVIGSNGGQDRIASLSRLSGASMHRIENAGEGDVLAFGRLDHIATGETFGDAKMGAPRPILTAIPTQGPFHSVALKICDRKDEARLAAALAKLMEEDLALRFDHDQTHGEMRLSGLGEMHLRVALERLKARFGVRLETHPPKIAYRETIRHAVSVRGRHKKQSGGHGQFGDVALEVRPRPRGEGLAFSETVRGGSVPRQYFASVELGCRDACEKGPLGFPVVDVEAILTDGSYHSVDSSDLAFRSAARLGMTQALEKADPLLLEPVMAVQIYTPSEGLSRASALVSSRRGQIIGFDQRPGWAGWDVIDARIPQADMGGFIVELRSASAGVASFTAKFDHMAELLGKPAEQVVERERRLASA